MIAFRPEVAGVPESPLVQIATVAEATPNAIKLCYGESDEPTPEFICRAAKEALDGHHTFYTHTAGYAALREAIAAKVFELHGVEYQGAEIMCTVGASMAVFIAIRACVGPGDNAIVITPAYAIFANAVRLVGGEARAVPLVLDGKRFCLDLDRVERAMDAGTRMLIVNSPSNPTGWVITVEEQRALYRLAEKHDAIVLSDEVYERIVFDNAIAPSFAPVAADRDHLIVVNSFSKTYNMTGWRLGWAQGSERLIRLMYSAAEFITSNPAAMVQQAGLAALRDGEPYVRDLRARYAARRRQTRDVAGGRARCLAAGGGRRVLRISKDRRCNRFGRVHHPSVARDRSGPGARRRFWRRRRGPRAHLLRLVGACGDRRDGAPPVICFANRRRVRAVARASYAMTSGCGSNL